MKVLAKDAKPAEWYEVYRNRERVLCCSHRSFWTPDTETFELGDDVELTHLPDCTGWDWKQPKPEATYAEIHAASDLQVGDRVRVKERTEPDGWRSPWWPGMDAAAGKVFEIDRDGELYGFRCGGFYFPCTSLEKVEKKYRPFANAAEFAPHRGRWVYFCDDITNQLLPSSFQDRGIWHAKRITRWAELFSQCKFADDGTPFGVEVTE